MRRTKPAKHKERQNADLILTADLHISETTPVSRTDDYMQAQENKLKFLQQLSYENNSCPILCAGDVFDKWKTSPWLSFWAYKNLPTRMICIPGNHDLPMQAMEYYEKSALHLLEVVCQHEHYEYFQVLKNNEEIHENIYIYGIPFGQKLKEEQLKKIQKWNGKKVLMLHEMVWQAANIPSWSSAKSGIDILKEYPDFDLIVVGDNHESFCTEYAGRILVNPGSILRKTVDQKDFKPRCFLYYAAAAGADTVEPVFFPIEENVHQTRQLQEKKNYEKRIAYIEKMNLEWRGGLSFRDNLQIFFEENKVSTKIREMIWECLECTV